MTLGGYGEIHANFVEGADGDQIDIHRDPGLDYRG